MRRRFPKWARAVAVSMPLLALGCRASGGETQGGERTPDVTSGGAAGESVGEAPVEAVPPAAPEGASTSHVDERWGFRIELPDRWVVRAEKLSATPPFRPAPAASLRVLSPEMAASGMGDAELPDLAIRVFERPSEGPLEAWLVESGLAERAGAGSARPTRLSGRSAFEVCSATMIAPGCSTFLAHARRVYQLTPASQAGEAVGKSFELVLD